MPSLWILDAVLFLGASALALLAFRVHALDNRIEQLTQGEATTVTTLKQLDDAIAAETQEITTLEQAVTAVDTDIENLLAEIASGGNVDVTKELQAIQANTSAIAKVVSDAQAEDQKVNPSGPSNQGEIPKA